MVAAVVVQKANEDAAAAKAVEAAPAAVQAATEDAEAVEARAGQSEAKIGFNGQPMSSFKGTPDLND